MQKDWQPHNLKHAQYLSHEVYFCAVIEQTANDTLMSTARCLPHGQSQFVRVLQSIIFWSHLAASVLMQLLDCQRYHHSQAPTGSSYRPSVYICEHTLRCQFITHPQFFYAGNAAHTKTQHTRGEGINSSLRLLEE